MWQRFSVTARRVVVGARVIREPADAEELLLALVRDPDHDLVSLFERLGVDRDAVARDVVAFSKVLRTTRPADEVVGAGLTRRAAFVLGAALTEAQAQNHEEADPRHLLLGLVRVRDGVAGLVIERVGLNVEATRRIVKGLADTQERTALRAC